MPDCLIIDSLTKVFEYAVYPSTPNSRERGSAPTFCLCVSWGTAWEHKMNPPLCSCIYTSRALVAEAKALHQGSLQGKLRAKATSSSMGLISQICPEWCTTKPLCACKHQGRLLGMDGYTRPCTNSGFSSNREEPQL